MTISKCTMYVYYISLDYREYVLKYETDLLVLKLDSLQQTTGLSKPQGVVILTFYLFLKFDILFINYTMLYYATFISMQLIYILTLFTVVG